jgi:integrase
MQWGHVRGDTILVIQGKTGARLEIPLTRHLSAALDATERQSLFILTKDMSKTKRLGQWEYRGASDAMRAAREAIGAQDYDLHGLRYTAAVELLLAGCNDDLISAVTGQSAAMVRHYTRHVRQRVRAREAQERRG